MFREDAEEARKPEGADRGIDRFKRPAEDLGTHVDAKGRLKRRARVASPRRGRGERFGTPALRRAGGRVL